MNSQEQGTLFLSTNKKPQRQQQLEKFFFRNTISSLPDRNKRSQSLADLTKQDKQSQITQIFNSYNLFKYSKVLTQRRSSLGFTANDTKFRDSSKNSQRKIDSDKLNPEIKKYRNGQEIKKGSKQLRSRLDVLKVDRNQIFGEIKKFVKM